jgi:homoserine kinase type II
VAVYTHISEAPLRVFLSDYDLGSLKAFKGIAEGVENSNYLLETSKGHFILTLFEKRVHEQDLPYYLNLKTHLAAHGFPCPTPIADKNGVVKKSLAGRPAVIVSFLNGYEVEDITPVHCEQVGQLLAQLHLAGRDFDMTRANDLSVNGWQDLARKCAGKLNSEFPGLEGLVGEELGALKALWPQDLPTGAIHADLFPDNVFFLKDEAVGAIDFYFACTDAYAYDIAITANAWCFNEEHKFEEARFKALISGYNSTRKLEKREEQTLVILCRGAALRFLLTRAHDWIFPQEGAIVTPKNPLDYEKRLQHWRNWGQN